MSNNGDINLDIWVIMHFSLDIFIRIIHISLMPNRHNNTLCAVDLQGFFDNPASRRQRQYEAVRAFIKDNATTHEIANKFGYTTATVHALVRDARAGKLQLFPEIKMGPKGRRVTE